MQEVSLSRRRFIKGASLASVVIGTATARPQALPDAVAAERTAKSHRKIALEEHFMLPEFIGYFANAKQNINPRLFDRAIPILSDFGERRLSMMDENGVDFAVLSLSGPGVQIESNSQVAGKLARQCNDALAREISKRPNRYGGFAHLALQDPEEAANELERCVRQLGFKGALINGETNGIYLDDRRCDVFWERAAALRSPIYIHPGNSPDRPHMFADHPEMWGPTYSWAVETCAHALRLIFSGVFDRYPDARVILGHMGETLPIQLWRLDSRIKISNQIHPIKNQPSYYVKKNIRVTTSGVCSDAALQCAIDALGADNVMFSIDYPFESTAVAANWIESASISDDRRLKVCSGNAAALLGL
ncbi:MAG: amidohydrolase family protein [Pseudomonadota bacterium]